MKTKITLSDLLPRLEGLQKDLADSILAALENEGLTPNTTSVRRVEIETKAEDPNDDDRSITAYLSTRHLDRDSEVIDPKGIDTAHFKLNPVVLEGHNYAKPQIGRAEKLRKDEMGLRAKVVFAPPVAGQVDYFLLSKFMPLKFSIGFIPLEILKKDAPGWAGAIKDYTNQWTEFKRNAKKTERIHRKILLLETSVTPMPANVFAGQQKAIDDAIAEGKITKEDAVVIRKSFDPESKPPPDIENKEGLPEDFKSWEDFYSKTIPCGPDGAPIFEQKPFPNEHAARLTSPGQYDEFRRRNNAFGSGIHAIFGIKKGPPRKSELQAIRFDKTKFTVTQAKAWLKAHDHKWILFEPATGKAAVKIIVAKPYAPKVTLVRRAISEKQLVEMIEKSVKNVLALQMGRV